MNRAEMTQMAKEANLNRNFIDTTFINFLEAFQTRVIEEFKNEQRGIQEPIQAVPSAMESPYYRRDY